MKIIIVEDVKKIRDLLVNLITSKFNDIVILAQTNSVNEAYSFINNLNPDLILLDIELIDGSGFELLNKFPKNKFKTIFITGNSDRAIEAIKQDAIDYIVKPINPEELYKAIDKVKKIVDKEHLDNILQFISTNLKSNKPKNRLTLKTATNIYSINISDIVRCESEGKYTTFYLSNNKKIVMSRPLKEYEEELDGYGFFRVHQSHLINMLFFESLLKQLDVTILLTNGHKVPLASRKKIEFVQYIETQL